MRKIKKIVTFITRYIVYMRCNSYTCTIHMNMMSANTIQKHLFVLVYLIYITILTFQMLPAKCYISIHIRITLCMRLCRHLQRAQIQSQTNTHTSIPLNLFCMCWCLCLWSWFFQPLLINYSKLCMCVLGVRLYAMQIYNFEIFIENERTSEWVNEQAKDSQMKRQLIQNKIIIDNTKYTI